MPALSKTPERRSNKAFLPPKASRAHAFASCCAIVPLGTAVANERRLAVCIFETSRSSVSRTTHEPEASPYGLWTGPPGAESGPVLPPRLIERGYLPAQAISYWETDAELREFCGCSPA